MNESTLLQASIDELEREKGVRERCYDRWITQGVCTLTDARDRMERLQRAIRYLRELQTTCERHVHLENVPDDDAATTPGP